MTTRVAGQARSALVDLRADGSVDPRFRADVAGSVYALDVAGDRLWIGGSVLHVAGVERNDLAVVDAQTGALSPIAPPATDRVDALGRAGTRIYMGGVNQAARGPR